MSLLFLFLFTRVISTTGFVIVVLLASSCLLYTRQVRRAGVLTGTALGLMASIEFLKNLFQVARPETALIYLDSYAFPSGHGAGSMYLGLLAVLLARATKPPLRYFIYLGAFLFVLVIGWSRIILGVHTPAQVGAGYVVGAVWALVYVKLRGVRERGRG